MAAAQGAQIHPAVAAVPVPREGTLQAQAVGQVLPQAGDQLGPLVGVLGEEVVQPHHTQGQQGQQKQGEGPGRGGARQPVGALLVQQLVALAQGPGGEQQHAPEQQQRPQGPGRRQQGDGHVGQQEQPGEAKGGQGAFPPGPEEGEQPEEGDLHSHPEQGGDLGLAVGVDGVGELGQRNAQLVPVGLEHQIGGDGKALLQVFPLPPGPQRPHHQTRQGDNDPGLAVHGGQAEGQAAAGPHPEEDQGLDGNLERGEDAPQCAQAP